MRRFLRLSLITVASVFLLWKAADSWQLIKWFSFDRKDALSEWVEKVFRGRVLYTIKPDPEKGYLLAQSEKSASALFYNINYSPKKHPFISWKWKVDKFPSKDTQGISTKKGWIERDDYAVRVYVIFPSFIFTNTRCLEYIWSEFLPKGTILTSPFFENIKLMILESGSDVLGEWVFEERNVLADYRAAFGRDASSNIGAIAIMTDSDNTASSALASYSDIKVGYEKRIKSIGPNEVMDVIEGKPRRRNLIFKIIENFFRFILPG